MSARLAPFRMLLRRRFPTIKKSWLLKDLLKPLGWEDELKGWTGKRLIVDLSLHRTWTEEIPDEDRRTYWGGRGLNGRFFVDHAGPGITPASPENLIAFSLGPLSGTMAPCSGWTSVSTISPASSAPGYASLSLPGHWGPQLKYAGFDQLVVRGRAEKPLYLFIEGGKARFEDAHSLWGKDTVETTVSIQEENDSRDTEVLCIGPAGETLVSFANVVNRFSWTGDHIGLGYVFGAKNLKAIAVHGKVPVNLHDPDRFLRTCLTLIKKIERDPTATKLKEEGTFLAVRNGNGGFGIKNYDTLSTPGIEKEWKSAYFKNYFYGKEGCFSCPIHCGRITDVDGNYFGGVHFESAWSLGPRIGIEEWEKTLLLHRVCQLQGLDPASTGSLLSWIMDCYEKGVLSSKELGPMPYPWGDEKAALHLIESVVGKKGAGEILSQGSLRAACSLGKGIEQVSHFNGTDLPARAPRSSAEYALSRALFPFEWDYLQSLSGVLPPLSSETQTVAVLNNVLAQEKQKVLADLNSLCPLVVARIPLLTGPEIRELIAAATGIELDEKGLMESIQNTLRIERALRQRFNPGKSDVDPLPLRFFNDPSEKRGLEEIVANYENTENGNEFLF